VRKVLGERFHLLSRLRCNNVLYAQPDAAQPGQRGRHSKYGKRLGSVTDRAAEVRRKTKIYSVNLYGKRREVCAYDAVVMLKTFKCPVRVVWVFRKTQWVAMFTTDLALSVTQIIEYYGARWKIEIDQSCCLHKSVFRKLFNRFCHWFYPGTFNSPQFT
jgi:hypothetical protein